MNLKQIKITLNTYKQNNMINQFKSLQNKQIHNKTLFFI